MTERDLDWSVEVDRGPDCLFVRVHGPKPRGSQNRWRAVDPAFAERLWSLMQQHFTNRLVLECDDLPPLCSESIGQLMSLSQRIAQRQGMLRLCGISDENRSVLEATCSDTTLPIYRDRTEAMMGYRPQQPR